MNLSSIDRKDSKFRSFTVTSSITQFVADPENPENEELELMLENVKKLNGVITNLMERISRLNKKRSKYSKRILLTSKQPNFDTTQTTVFFQTSNINKQNDRMQRISACSKLLNSKNPLPSLNKNTKLPNLPDLKLVTKTKSDNNDNISENDKESTRTVNKIAQFLKSSQPDLIYSYFNETGLPFLMILCNQPNYNVKPFDIDLLGFHNAAPNVLSTVAPEIRQLLIKYFFKSMLDSANIVSAYEDSFLDIDDSQLLNLIETHAAIAINAKKVRLFLGSDYGDELIHMNGNVRVVIPLSYKGLISSCVKKMEYAIVNDPNNSSMLDVAVESQLFEGAKNAMICPLIHPKHKNPFVFLALDKLKETNFAGVDFILLSYIFQFLTVAIEKVHRSITKVSVKDQLNLIDGLGNIASQKNSHDMIKKISEVSNNLTSATFCRIFSIIDDNLFEETSSNIFQNKIIPVDEGLIGKSVISDCTQNYILPRRESDFSVQADDIIEPRLWAMVSSPARYNGEITMNLSLYNRSLNTFFAAKEVQIISSLARCICPFLYKACQHSKLQESLKSDTSNSNRSHNLAVFSLKAIETAGTLKIFKEMQRFCEHLQPHVSLRLLLYDSDNLLELPDMKNVPSQPQLLDALCNMKPTAATTEHKGILVFPIKIDGINKIFLFEFTADLLHLKTAEEENGIMQRSRLLQAMDEAGLSKRISDLQEQFRNTMHNPLQNSRSGSSSSFRTNHSFSRTYGQKNPHNNIFQSTMPKLNLPFIPLSIKSIHEDNMSSTSLFEIGDDHCKNSGDKLLVVQSSRKTKSFHGTANLMHLKYPSSISLNSLNSTINNSNISFGNQLDDDSLEIFPFDPFLTSTLQSFSNHSTRQILLHMKIMTLNQYKITARSLHILGNSLSSPMMFSKLLTIMMVAFNNLFGKDVSIKIFDPPLSEPIETGPTIFNLERDRMIFSSIKIPTELNVEKSAALASFADLLTNLIESRSESEVLNPVSTKNSENYEEQGMEFESSNLTTNEMVSLVYKYFQLFHITECLKCDELTTLKWLGTLGAKYQDTGSFMIMTDSLHFLYFILHETDLLDKFNPSELCALSLSVFFGLCNNQVHPNFKYERALEMAIKKNTSQKALTRAATNLILLGDDSNDLLANTPFNLLLGITELMIEQVSKSPLITLTTFHAINKKFDFNNNFHKLTLKKLLIDISIQSMYFAPLSSFGVWAITFGKEPIENILFRGKTTIIRYAEELASFNPKFSSFPELVKQKNEWMAQHADRKVSNFTQEEEDDENMSLGNTR